LMGKVDFGGVAREVCLAYVPDVRVDDYVIVHVGFALSKIDAAEAARTYALLAELGALEAPDEPEGGGP
jgi:hydrogenase expression/formation protein HypC